MKEVATFLIFIGIFIAGIGIFLFFSDKIPFFGRLPGDIIIKRDGLTLFIPLGTSILISLITTIVLNLLFRN